LRCNERASPENATGYQHASRLTRECRDWRKIKTLAWREANKEWRLFERGEQLAGRSYSRITLGPVVLASSTIDPIFQILNKRIALSGDG